MTSQEFTAFYPQFANFTPAVVMDTYIAQANKRFSFMEETDMNEARRLYVAHRVTLYAQAALPAGATPTTAAIASAGELRQRASSKKVDDVQISYSSASGAAESAQTGFADLSMTSFGLQLLSLLRLYSCTRYIP